MNELSFLCSGALFTSAGSQDDKGRVMAHVIDVSFFGCAVAIGRGYVLRQAAGRVSCPSYVEIVTTEEGKPSVIHESVDIDRVIPRSFSVSFITSKN